MCTPNTSFLVYEIFMCTIRMLWNKCCEMMFLRLSEVATLILSVVHCTCTYHIHFYFHFHLLSYSVLLFSLFLSYLFAFSRSLSLSLFGLLANTKYGQWLCLQLHAIYRLLLLNDNHVQPDSGAKEMPCILSI